MSLFFQENMYLSTQLELFLNNFNFLLKFCKAHAEYIDAMKRD
jgi:hypothetical protein